MIAIPGKRICLFFRVLLLFFCEVFSFLYQIFELIVHFPPKTSFFPRPTDIPREHPPQERSCLACTYQTTHQKQTRAIHRPSNISNERGEPPRAPKNDSKIHLKTVFVSSQLPLRNPLCSYTFLFCFAKPLWWSKRKVAQNDWPVFPKTSTNISGVRSFWHSRNPCAKNPAQERAPERPPTWFWEEFHCVPLLGQKSSRH